jgi:hypothetical protein
MDSVPIVVSESSFNYNESRYNYHVITLGENWTVLGNIHTHYNILKP